MQALLFLHAALDTAEAAAFQPSLPELVPPVLAAVAERYYRVRRTFMSDVIGWCKGLSADPHTAYDEWSISCASIAVGSTYSNLAEFLPVSRCSVSLGGQALQLDGPAHFVNTALRCSTGVRAGAAGDRADGAHHQAGPRPERARKAQGWCCIASQHYFSWALGLKLQLPARFQGLTTCVSIP